MKTKTLITLLILSLPITLLAQTYGWMNLSDRINSEIGVALLEDVQFIGQEGWIASWNYSGGAGEIFHTTDGGRTFEIQTTMCATRTIWMLSNTVGYCAGVSGIVLKTIDGGDTWNYHGTTGANSIMDICFPPGSDTGFYCGTNGANGRITEDGVIIDTVYTPYDLESLSFAFPDEGYCCGEWGIYHYLDGAWCRDQYYRHEYHMGIHFQEGTTLGWIACDDGNIDHTTDGYDWYMQPSPDSNDISLISVCFIDTSQGWTAGWGGLILHTTNGGQDWERVADGLTDNSFTTIFAVSSTEVYAVGVNGTFLKYGDMTGIDDNKQLPARVSLHQNYPNPFNVSTSIRFELNRQSQITLDIYNVLGSKITTITNGIYPAGNHAVSFDASPYASGIYFYKLDTGDYTETKKMLLIK